MKNHLDQAFFRTHLTKKKALIAYVTAGFPRFSEQERLLKAMDQAGVDVLELGVPFSDPIADGPTIQASSQESLQNGTSLRKILTWAKRMRPQVSMPFVVMSYLNPILKYGVRAFAKDAAQSGVSGLIVPDLIPEEGRDLEHVLNQFNIHMIYLLAPTTPRQRQKRIVAQSNGFLYAVSVTGVTGARKTFSGHTKTWLKGIRQKAKTPVCVGFGISGPKQIRQLKSSVDGFIVGSALINLIQSNKGTKRIKKVSQFIRQLARSVMIMAADKKGSKPNIPEGLWSKCPKCAQIIYKKELETNLKVCPKCSYCFPMAAFERVQLLLDEGSVEELDASMESTDPLEFIDGKTYKDKLAKSKEKTKAKDAVWTGSGKMEGLDVTLAVMDFRFLGGSMGSVVGEKIARAVEHAMDFRMPLIVVSTSGGARMHEGIFSLMQMAKVSAVLAQLRKKRIPFISVLSDPTTGGVTASYAMLGDVNFAEPGALIGFAGPRVIEQTIRQTLPDGFQRSEFLVKHGMIDRIIPRSELKAEIRRTLRFLEKGYKKK